jgi:hypothetical protein
MMRENTVDRLQLCARDGDEEQSAARLHCSRMGRKEHSAARLPPQATQEKKKCRLAASLRYAKQKLYTARLLLSHTPPREGWGKEKRHRAAAPGMETAARTPPWPLPMRQGREAGKMWRK